jgi:hypothetical protein
MKNIFHDETQRIELATGQSFFTLYNSEYGTSYRIDRIAGEGEAPDVFATDIEGRKFNLEITLTEDRPGDIATVLGRGKQDSSANLKRHLQAVRESKETLQINSLHENALPILLSRISKKLQKDYGPGTALVVRDTSPLWDWEQVLPIIREHLRGKAKMFDLGIWLLSFDKTSITQLYPQSEQNDA